MRIALSGQDRFESAGEGRWMLIQGTSRGLPAIGLSQGPFVIGRASDCQLILPESAELRTQTSRWHCSIRLEGSQWLIADGGLQTQPETGKPKPSITGTKVNGTRIPGPTALRPGDSFEIGPWKFSVPAELPADPELLEKVAKGTARRVDAADPKLKAQFGQLHELVLRLAKTPSIEESLTALLSYATAKIPGAEVAAILLADETGEFRARLAWQKDLGRMPEFPFSSALLNSLPAEQSFLLQGHVADPSKSQYLQDISSGLLLPLWGKGQRLGVLYMDNRRQGTNFSEEDLYLGSALASLISLQLALEAQADMTRIKENMARYFAPDVVQRIVERSAQAHIMGLEVQEKDITVMFTDLEGFTALSRTKTPQEITEILNPYLETVACCIQGENGHVNKFIGDAVMGIFGAQPGDQNSDAAVYAAQAVNAALLIPDAWAREAKKRNIPALRVRIGLNSGRAVVGNIGYRSRLEYSVLGDAVNVASRFEKLSPPNRCAVSQSTRDLTQGLFDYQDLGEREVKGVGKVKVYSPVRARMEKAFKAH